MTITALFCGVLNMTAFYTSNFPYAGTIQEPTEMLTFLIMTAVASVVAFAARGKNLALVAIVKAAPGIFALSPIYLRCRHGAQPTPSFWTLGSKEYFSR